MGMSFQPEGDEGGTMLSEINVTPLVDVMLVLLIIFMVTAPLMQQGMTVDLPKTQSQSMPGDDATLVVTLDASMKLFILKTEVSPEELQTKLSAIAANNPNKEVFLKADETVPYGKVVAVMGIIQAAGLTRLGVVTQPGKETL